MSLVLVGVEKNSRNVVSRRIYNTQLSQNSYSLLTPNHMQLRTLQHTPLSTIVDAFNKAFERYFVPIEMTEEQLAFKMKVDRTSLRYSVGAFEAEALVGFILHGVARHRGQVSAYNAGTGVLESHRGQQLAQKMYGYALPLLRKAGIGYTLLEVIKENIRAQKPYKKIGFERLRTVNSYELAASEKLRHRVCGPIRRLFLPVYWIYFSIGCLVPTLWQYSGTI
jgi:ribosomal protein S18 acetylase RimI-like enzyme